MMDHEMPRGDNSISNRQLLMKELHIEKLMKRNKVYTSLILHSVSGADSGGGAPGARPP